MPPTDIAELRRLHEAATTGKWFAFRLSVASTSVLVGNIVCQPPDEDCEESLKQWPHNADYISAVRNALPALLDELEALREKVRLQALVIDELPEEVAGLHAVIELQREMIAHKDVRDRHTKLIGAAEALERLAKVNQHRMLDCNDLTELAAQLRREAEGK